MLVLTVFLLIRLLFLFPRFFSNLQQRLTFIPISSQCRLLIFTKSDVVICCCFYILAMSCNSIFHTYSVAHCHMPFELLLAVSGYDQEQLAQSLSFPKSIIIFIQKKALFYSHYHQPILNIHSWKLVICMLKSLFSLIIYIKRQNFTTLNL